MPRKSRLTAPSTVYHVTIRCNNKEHLMRTRKDLESFVCVTAHYKKKHAFKLFGYCIMNSHAHLVIQTPGNEEKTISAIMHDINSLYARDYNTRHGRTGHVWGERFKSPIVESDVHGVALLRYIAQNPVRAKMVKHAREWEFSSFHAYEQGEPNIFVDLMPSFLGLARSPKRAAELFVALVEGEVVKQDDCWTRTYALGSEQFVKKLLGQLHDPLAAGPPG